MRIDRVPQCALTGCLNAHSHGASMRIHMVPQCALKRVGGAVEERRRRGIYDKYGFGDESLCGLQKDSRDFADGL